jgi:hypothetical protein
MRRYLRALMLVVALAMPAAPAVAGTRRFDGAVDPSGGVSFDTRTRHGTTTKVVPGLSFSHVPMSCDDGGHAVSGSYDFAMWVVHRAFEGTGIYTGGGKVTVRGKFSLSGGRARGTIRLFGDFSAIHATGCHAKHDWTAKTA